MKPAKNGTQKSRKSTNAIGKTFEVLQGDTPIATALREL